MWAGLGDSGKPTFLCQKPSKCVAWLRFGREGVHFVLRPRQQRFVVVVDQQTVLRRRQRRVRGPRLHVCHARDELEAIPRRRPARVHAQRMVKMPDFEMALDMREQSGKA